MKHRNPLFVAGFPYALILVGYAGIVIVNIMDQHKAGLNGTQIVALVVGAALIAVGLGYNYYWFITTARGLRSQTKAPIPTTWLIVVPLANYWWMWRYSQAVEAYTKEKLQAALAFLLIAALGSIGMGIIQDSYNKHAVTSKASS